MGILVAIIGVCIPIVAIISSHQYKIQKLKIEQQGKNVQSEKVQRLERQLQNLASENRDLKQRLNNVETIVSDPDFLLGLPEKDETKSVQQVLDALAEQKKKRDNA